ncbi:MAG TPA: LytTR family DNA-binding domain-containing protein [Bacteroidia bacterium]|nr:LytTR family DNA-binding domain-containing protein [Bacteroidia bacterium]
MNTIIVDDDPISRELLKICVDRTESLKLVGSYDGVREAMSVLKEGKSVDLILLDIEMPEINGIDFLNTFKQMPHVIVISSKKDYAVDAFDNNVIDYIVKPINYDRFLRAIKKVEGHSVGPGYCSGESSDFIFVRHKNRLQRVSIEDIEYVEANADYVNIVTKDTKYVVHSSMKNIESRFPAKNFVRAHRSFIVNIDKANTIEENTLYLGEKGIPIGRLYKENLLQRLNFI